MVLTLTITSCGENHQAKDTDDSETTDQLDVELNQGKRWEANTETTKGIANMKRMADQMRKNPEVKDYHILAKELEKEFSDIFKKCTMKGEAHNQLHNYLVPLKSYIMGLQSDEELVRQESYKSIQEHLKAYNNYFQ
jgi:hypothetical protein